LHKHTGLDSHAKKPGSAAQYYLIAIATRCRSAMQNTWSRKEVALFDRGQCKSPRKRLDYDNFKNIPALKAAKIK
jgi:hypothetical protein